MRESPGGFWPFPGGEYRERGFVLELSIMNYSLPSSKRKSNPLFFFLSSVWPKWWARPLDGDEVFSAFVLACSRRPDSRAREKNSRRKKKQRGETRGRKGERTPVNIPLQSSFRL